jgi:hypothetical protein
MSRSSLIIIVIALLILIATVSYAAHYFGILLAEDKAIGSDGEYPDDDDDAGYDDDDYDEYNDDDEYPETIPASPEFLMKFAEYYVEEKIHLENSHMKAFAPRLFSDTWYEETRREFSAWSVEIREAYAIAA